MASCTLRTLLVVLVFAATVVVARPHRAAAARIPKADVAYLPDPYAFQNGTRLTSASQWPELAAEHSALLQQLELGIKPAVPEVAATFSGKSVNVSVTLNERTISFVCAITYPSGGQAPYPAVIGVGGVSLDTSILSQLGVATITFPNNQIAEQNDVSSRGKGLFYDLYGADASAGAMMAWAWGIDCLVTALELTADDNKIDVKHLATTGCSRNGKGAAVAAAFVDRIVLGLPQESGSGGADSWRVSDSMMASGIKTQTLLEIVQENVWFMDAFSTFVNHTNALPFDHHMLATLMAPSRAILFIENSGIDWLGGYSGWVALNAAHKVFTALGVPDSVGFTAVSHQDHCSFQASQASALKAYVQRFLLEQTEVSTAVLSIDTNSTIDPAWMPWTAPFGLRESVPQKASCGVRAVDQGSSLSNLRFTILAGDRTIESVRVMSAGVRSLALHATSSTRFEAAMPANSHRPLHLPLTLAVHTTDGVSTHIKVTQLGRGREFTCA